MQSNYEELLDSILSYIPNMLNGIESTVIKLNANNVAQAIDNILLIIEGIQWILDAIVIMNSYEENCIDIVMLNTIFKEMIGAFENSDYVLLKDILKFELYPSVEKILEDLQLTFIVTKGDLH